jgi:hypothetical protein
MVSSLARVGKEIIALRLVLKEEVYKRSKINKVIAYVCRSPKPYQGHGLYLR